MQVNASKPTNASKMNDGKPKKVVAIHLVAGGFAGLVEGKFFIHSFTLISPFVPSARHNQGPSSVAWREKRNQPDQFNRSKGQSCIIIQNL